MTIRHRPKVVFISYSGIGDLLMALPLFAVLREKYRVLPLITTNHQEIARILLEDDRIESGLFIDRSVRFRSDPLGHLRILAELRRLHPEAVFIYGKTLLSVAATLGLVQADLVRCCLPGRGPIKLLKPSIIVRSSGNQTHNYMRFSETLGIRAAPDSIRLSDPYKARLIDESRFLNVPEQYVVVAPWSSEPKRNVPLSFFEGCIRFLTDELGMPIALTGTKEHRRKSIELLRKLPDRPMINLVGRTSLRQLLGLIAGARTLVTNESGNMHLALLVDTPQAVAFSTKSPEELLAERDLELVSRILPRGASFQGEADWGYTKRILAQRCRTLSDGPSAQKGKTPAVKKGFPSPRGTSPRGARGIKEGGADFHGNLRRS